MNKMNSSFQKKEMSKKEKLEKIVPPHSRISVLNIGQLLFLAFLFVMLLFQSMNIYTSNSRNPADITDISDILNISSGEGGELSHEKNAVLFGGENSSADSDMNTAGRGAIFILGEYNGKLAVLSPDRKTVYETFDVYINTLPKYDINLLSDGIEIRSQEELLSLLEDYSS